MDRKDHSLDDDDEFYIEPGEYSYNFRIVLPSNLPTSFEHKNAVIRYVVEAKIDLPSIWKSGESVHKILSVVNQLDLNHVVSARAPSMVSEAKMLWCGLFQHDNITCELAIQKCKLS